MKPMIYLRLATYCLVLLFLPAIGRGTNYYADPSAAGSMSNNGSYLSPWAGLSSIFAANKTFQAGDTIFLRTGYHGYTLLRGNNSGYVVIMPQPGESPIIERMRVSASAAITASYWKLYQLTFQSESTGTNATPSYTLLEIYSFATNITVSHCTVSSNLNTDGWSRNDWRNRCNNGISTRGRLNANHIIEYNLIINTAFALTVSSSSTIVRGNTIRNFTNDACRVLGSDILFENNKVYDLIKVMTVSENHDDLFQSFVYPAGGTGQDSLKNDIIRGNIFISTTDTTRAFRGNPQGIGCFDGEFLNWRIENNIVITDHWHGISMYGAVNCIIVNNTVIDPYKYSPVDPFDNNSSNIGPTWIRIDKKSSGPPSVNNIVKNNLVSNSVIIVSPDMGTASNNQVLGAISNNANFFADVSNLAQPINFDLHLKAGCSAIDAGDNVGAPLFDFDNIARPQGANVDLGAYEFVPVSGIAEHQADAGIKIYPNPSTGKFLIELEDLRAENPFNLQIISTLGAVIYHNENIAQHVPIELDLSVFPKGLYVVKIQDGAKTFHRSVLLQ